MGLEIRYPQEDGQVFTDMADDPANPCLGCAACCRSYRVSFYQGELVSAGGCVPDELVSPVTPFLVCMKGTEKGGAPCGALVRTSHSGEWRCGIYAARSSTCRAFNAWTDACDQARQRVGLAALPRQPS